MTREKLTLAVVEDDAEVRTALNRLLRSMGHDVRLFESAEAFDERPAQVDCLILDVRLPGLSGIELSERLRRRGLRLPVVFITGDANPAGERARVSGQVEVPAVSKPFSDQELMSAVAKAISSRDH
jgi:FixJ family two-component response regulator